MSPVRRPLLIGERFGMLVVVGPAPARGVRTYLEVRCDCGRSRVVMQQSLVGAIARSCGCLRRVKAHAARQTPEPPPIPGTRWIALTQGRFALVDEQDFDWLTAMGFWTYGAHGYAYCNRNSGGPLRMHAAIMPSRERMRVDHANRNRLDNRRCNLRYATYTQNCANRKIEKGNKAGYKGVSRAGRSMWRASIRAHDKQYHIGSAHDAWTASCLYDGAAKKLFGEFAALNDSPMPSVPEHLLSLNVRSAK